MNHRHAIIKYSKILAIKRLGFLSIIISLAYASFETAWPMLLSNIFHSNSEIGFVTASLTIISLLAYLGLVPLFEKIPTKTLFFISMSLNAIAIILFAFTRTPGYFFIVAIINVILTSVRVQAFGILLRDNSSAKTIGENENTIYMLGNIGWGIGPLIAGIVAFFLSYQFVFIYAAFMILLAVYIYSFTSFKEHKQEFEKINIMKNLFKFFKNKERTKAYILNGGLEVWWAYPYVFIPLEMIRLNFTALHIGLFLFLLTLPMIFSEYLTEKNIIRISAKRKLIYGYSFIGILTVVNLIFSYNIIYSLGIIIIASLAMGILEPTTEGLFFSITKQNEERKYYGPFVTSKTVGAFIGHLSIASIITIFPLTYVNIFYMIAMGFFVWIARKLK